MLDRCAEMIASQQLLSHPKAVALGILLGGCGRAHEAERVAPSSAASGPRPYVLLSRFGCTRASECRMPEPTCYRAPLIGQCSCRTDADCSPAETCEGSRCELRCFSENASECPRGGRCRVELLRCDHDFAPSDRNFEFDYRPPHMRPTEEETRRHRVALHATYDEWSGLMKHLRVSFRGDGSYVIEIDGWFHDAKPSNGKGKELLRNRTIRGTSTDTPLIASLHHAPSCSEYHSEFRAELVLVYGMTAYRGLWTHPKCPGFPTDYVDAIWRFVEQETGGALVRFDRTHWGDLPPIGAASAKPGAHRHPCWPGQQWSGTACTGRPTSCPLGYQPVENGCEDYAPSPSVPPAAGAASF